MGSGASRSRVELSIRSLVTGGGMGCFASPKQNTIQNHEQQKKNSRTNY
jgi:hypothetical protein